MTDSPHDWSHLPHDPIAFFGLEEAFSRRDLKKSYHRLIRLYKPERAPEEFQRIRAAYELLDGQLRYGREERGAANSGFDWGALTAAVATGSVAEPVSATVESAPSWSERLQAASAKELYTQLQAQAQKSPRDFYALALLSDIVAPQEKQMFLRWLLTGLQQHRGDPGLLALLRELLRTEPPPELATKSLITISKVVSNDQFYYLTEPVWDRLVNGVPFAKLQQTLSACEKNLRDIRVHGKVAFYIHLVRRVMWKAPPAWIENVIRFLNEHHSVIEKGFDYDMEFVEVVYQYRKSSEVSRVRGEVHDMIHKAISHYCELDELKGDRAVIGCQTRLANDSDGVLSAFPCYLEEADPLLAAWEFITDDVAARQSDPIPAEDKEMAKSAFHCLRDCHRSESGRSWSIALYGPFMLNVLVAVIVFALGNWLTPEDVFPFFAIAAAIIAAMTFYPVTRKLRQWLIVATIKRRYRGVWRERVARFAANTQLPFRYLLGLLHEAAQFHADEFHVGPWIVQLAAGDPGLAVYASARQFLR